MSELGNRLKEARLAKNLSLDDLQIATKIQKRYLVGIEEGNYSMMPGQFYVRAFIKQYAEAVGLHPEELFEQYKSEIPSTINEDIPEKLSRVQSRKEIANSGSKVFDILPKILIAVFIIGAAAVIYYFITLKGDGNQGKGPANNSESEQVRLEESDNFAKDTDKNSDKESATTDKETDSSQDEVIEEPIAPKQEITVLQSSGRQTIYELKNADKFELKVVSTGETWVNIKNGKGTSFFQGMLTKGDTESQTFDFSKETEATIVVGNSLQTEIYVNDEKIQFAIDPSKSVRQDITIRYLSSTE
ncbi:RodZ family helix-turn-helix domain-containing protein [Bacillus sp. S/N-304-OC-R1]|uniref:helix-turn-helix domain-containing protein n=1 Tax=Bacillus sp. S/N-304-OC-R1 TaxID=2758034 RepID=UPI001C8EA19D|nr:RodZ family helix-turn-helix domain-containing protein [Bacillus sp. S/N-304-OC-R1]MBY0120623.1 helix-turn-helix domain-containing protein [Bacillus sp. S/N-304-OC-R1]